MRPVCVASGHLVDCAELRAQCNLNLGSRLRLRVNHVRDFIVKRYYELGLDFFSSCKRIVHKPP